MCVTFRHSFQVTFLHSFFVFPLSHECKLSCLLFMANNYYILTNVVFFYCCCNFLCLKLLLYVQFCCQQLSSRLVPQTRLVFVSKTSPKGSCSQEHDVAIMKNKFLSNSRALLDSFSHSPWPGLGCLCLFLFVF